MSYKDITPGTKIAKALGARFVKSPKKGTLGCEVAFEFEEPSTGGIEIQNWTGWLSPAAIENTMDTLVNVLGFNGNDAVDKDGKLAPDSMDFGKQVSLVVEIEEYEGKSYPRIRWVNSLGGSAFQSCEPEVIKADLAALNFKGAFLAAKQASGATQVKAPAAQKLADDKVPF